MTPFLADNYHLLLPDLPGHGGSREISPFSKEHGARLLSQLIRERAAAGKAHVVGFSFGAHIAIELASKFPECVESVFVSGFEVYNVSPQTFVTVGSFESRLTSLVPRGLIKWLMDGTDLPTPQFQPSQDLRLAIAETMCIRDDEWPSPWQARTLIVAAGKSGLLPTADHPHDARKLRDTGREGNEETKAVTHPKMRHPWIWQAPELFAKAVRRWVEEAEVEEGFVSL